MAYRLAVVSAAAALAWAMPNSQIHAQDATALDARLDALEAQVTAAEDVSAIKRLQRTYGYYLDKGMWADLAELYADDAVTNYPAGVYIGKESIRKHLFMNVGGGQMGDIGLPDGRLYNHMNIQPVIHLDPGGQTAKGRWRAFAYFGAFGGGATWAEGVYEMTYEKDDGVWKIKTLDYHAGFGAPYATGWVPPEPGPAGAGGRGPRNLPHPPDQPRNMPCEGFPAACLAPFHYANPGTPEGGHVWTTVDVRHASGRRPDERDRAGDLAQRAQRLADEIAVENLQKTYGYYLDRRMWNEVADLFADNGTIEMDLRGVYVGKARVREFMNLLGPEGIKDGELNDHVQLQVVVDVAEDGRTAKARSRELDMLGVHEQGGQWSEGIYENSFVKENGVWKIQALRYFPTFITDYDQGWAKDAKPAPTASTTLPPDRPPTSVYEIFPQAHIPPYHYDNPVTGNAPQYPTGRGEPSAAAIAAIRAAVPGAGNGRARRAQERDVEALVVEAERQVARVMDFHELDNLESAYGYYLDKNLWNDLANLFAEDGSMELAQRGIYLGRERVRGFLFNVFGKEGPTEGRLGNHIQWQPVIHVADDGKTAKIRSRMMQQLSFGPRASMGASLYENEAVKEDGVWKFSVVHTFNTWTAGYDGGWAKSSGRGVPGPSKTYPPDGPPTFVFQMFPTVYQIPFHYPHPVTGLPVTPPPQHRNPPATLSNVPGMPPEIEAQVREIGPRIEAQKTTEIYAPLQPKEPYSWLSVTRDIAYGSHERNVLDVFTSPAPGTGKPVIVFVHGGGFARGAKRMEGAPFYDNVMLWAVGSGMIGVNINYRLAPENMWPSGIEDLTQVMSWLKANLARYGGDPSKIFLWGHSAGAAHVADYVAHAATSGRDTGAAGAILTSGFYDLGKEVSVWKAYYGEDVSTYAERSSLPGLLKTTTPLLVTDAELDPEMFQTQANLLAAEREKAGKPVRRVHLEAHSHISETFAIGTSDQSLSVPVRDFVRSITAAGT